MTDDEKALVEVLNQMTQEERQSILDLMRELVRQQDEATEPD